MTTKEKSSSSDRKKDTDKYMRNFGFSLMFTFSLGTISLLLSFYFAYDILGPGGFVMMFCMMAYANSAIYQEKLIMKKNKFLEQEEFIAMVKRSAEKLKDSKRNIQ